MADFVVRRTVASSVAAVAALLATPGLGAASAEGPLPVPWATPDHPSTDKPIVLGDLNAPARADDVGAPFDPCSTEAALPANVAAEIGHARGRQADTEPPFILCTYKISPDLVVGAGWAPVMTDLDAGEPTAFGSQVGEQQASHHEGQQRCETRVDVENGFAGVDVRSTAADPCELARTVSEHIAKTATS